LPFLPAVPPALTAVPVPPFPIVALPPVLAVVPVPPPLSAAPVPLSVFPVVPAPLVPALPPFKVVPVPGRAPVSRPPQPRPAMVANVRMKANERIGACGCNDSAKPKAARSAGSEPARWRKLCQPPAYNLASMSAISPSGRLWLAAPARTAAPGMP
jgi:hypothetical protein